MKKLMSLIIAVILAVSAFGFAGAFAEESNSLYVYQDFGSAENNFNMKAMMSASGYEDLVIPMNEEWDKDPYSGETCIRCQVNTQPDTWGGWMFLTGMLVEGQKYLVFNDAATPGQGLDLTGMHELRFRARGQNGGEHVEFICFGFGEGGSLAYPDTADKVSEKFDLTADWQEYVLSWDETDLTNIICGFGFACAGGDAAAENIFYLDDIRYLP